MDLSIKKETLLAADQSWLGSEHGTNMGRPITLRTASFVAATHYPDGFFKSGIPVGRITATGLYAPYNNAAVDGTDVLAGFLLDAPSSPSDNTVNVQGVLYEHGRVVEAKLPIAVDAPGKADVAGRIIFA